jgi:hypothetical protein
VRIDSAGYQPLRQSTARGLQPSQVDAHLPDISGLALHGDVFLAVTDAKLDSQNPRLGVLSGPEAPFQPLATDWSATGKARDLEGIAPIDGEAGRFVAVEGSNWDGMQARVLELEVGKDGARSQRAHTLPTFDQEVEGIFHKRLEDGRGLLVLGGRGGDGEAGRLYWGILEKGELRFSQEGRAGIPVDAPVLSEGQRDISDLHLDADGKLWASACNDRGDTGPFESSVYEVGSVGPDGQIRVERGKDTYVGGTKVEGLVRSGPGFVVASDDEALGGQVGFLIAHV